MNDLLGGTAFQPHSIVTQLCIRWLRAGLIFLLLSFSFGGISCIPQMQAQEQRKATATGLGKEFASETAKVNGITLHYVRGGKGNAVILIHGFPQDWFEYHAIMPGLAKQFTVIAVDLRGVGGSTATERGYDAANMAEDIYQLTKALKLERVYIVGHDIGGHVAYAFVRRYPDATRGAMILDTPIPGIEGWEEIQECALWIGTYRLCFALSISFFLNC
jgi:alpha-beta hydrolase superfamily lysophospholipase